MQEPHAAHMIITPTGVQIYSRMYIAGMPACFDEQILHSECLALPWGQNSLNWTGICEDWSDRFS